MTMRLLPLVLLIGCNCKAKQTEKPVAPPPVAPQPVPPQPVLEPAAVSGYWTGDWGKLVLEAQGDKVIGAYSHDNGVIVGTIKGDTLVGWWCETPSRKPSKDAGDVEMKFVTKDGKREIDGRWRYGADGAWKDDWDIAWDEGKPPEELVKRIADTSTHCVK